MRSAITQHTTTRLQLTSKGKALVGAMVLIAVALVVAVFWSRPAMPPAMAAEHHTPETYQQIVVQPGDTLWAISSRVSQGSERSVVLDHIVTYNDLESSDLRVGQTLYVPVMPD